MLDRGIDTSAAVGRMSFQILGSIAELEHALMSERTRDGLFAARARVPFRFGCVAGTAPWAAITVNLVGSGDVPTFGLRRLRSTLGPVAAMS